MDEEEEREDIYNTGGTVQSRYRTDFIEMEKLGQGGQGSVFKSKNILDGKIYAIKKVKLSRFKVDNVKLINEVTLLSSLSHVNIVRYF